MRFPIVLGLSILLLSCGSRKDVSSDQQPSSQQLLDLLQSVVADKEYIFGHADDTAYGHSWEYEEGRSDVKDVVGDYPGLINWDLGMLELDRAQNLDGVPFEFMTREIARQQSRGGINSISWHLRNPVTGGDSWDVTDSLVVSKILLEGSAENTMLIGWIGKAADFIGNLTDSEGNRIPVLFRPWHEHTGRWFWWGEGCSTPEDYKSLWKLTRSIFDKKGIDNVVWVYSPDKVADELRYLERYPGDDMVDVMGIDIYGNGSEEGVEAYRENVRSGLGIVSKVAADHGKIVAFTETGLESIPVADWFDGVLKPSVEEFPIAFLCVWRNAQADRKPMHFYAPYPGHMSAESFVRFYNDPKTLFAADLKKRSDNNCEE